MNIAQIQPIVATPQTEVVAMGKHALAESVIGLFKTEVIRQKGPWDNLEDVEFATLEWVWWFNDKRLLEPIGYIPSVENEKMFHSAQTNQVFEKLLN